MKKKLCALLVFLFVWTSCNSLNWAALDHTPHVAKNTAPFDEIRIELGHADMNIVVNAQAR